MPTEPVEPDETVEPVDPAIAALLAVINRVDGPKMQDMEPAEARAFFKKMVAVDGEPTPVRSVTDRTVPGPAGDIGVRVVVPEADRHDGVLVWLHGGGWVIGDLDTSESVARRLAALAGCVVVSVDYRLAPEVQAPHPFEDAWAATGWVADHLEELGLPADARVAVGGDSAGGNLAALVAVRAAESGGPALALQLLVYPGVDLTGGHPSMDENGEGYFLTREQMEWFGAHYVPDGADLADPSLSPLFVPVETLAGVAPAHVIVAGYDPLRDEGRAYAEKLMVAGVYTELAEYPSMIHGFFQMAAITPVAVEAAERAATALRRAFQAA